MDTPTRRELRAGVRWAERLPAAWFTRIVLPVRFAEIRRGDSALHRVGHDAEGIACYSHFACRFDCPRCFTAGQPGPRGHAAVRSDIVGRELRAWRTRSGRWLVCVVDRQRDRLDERTRYTMRAAMPSSICLDTDLSE